MAHPLIEALERIKRTSLSTAGLRHSRDIAAALLPLAHALVEVAEAAETLNWPNRRMVTALQHLQEVEKG